MQMKDAFPAGDLHTMRAASSALDVAGLILRELHRTIGSLLPKQADGSVYFLQSGAYLSQLSAALNNRDVMRSQIENIGFPANMSRDQIPIAEQILANMRTDLDKVAGNKEYGVIGERINAMRADLGLGDINWSKTVNIAPASQP